MENRQTLSSTPLKKAVKLFCWAIVLTAVAFFFANVYYNPYKYDPIIENEESSWLCKEPYIEARYSDNGASQVSFVKTDAGTLEVELVFSTENGIFTAYDISGAGYDEYSGGYYYTQENKLMEGKFVYGSDDIRVRITEDRIFGGEYEGEIIVFEREE